MLVQATAPFTEGAARVAAGKQAGGLASVVRPARPAGPRPSASHTWRTADDRAARTARLAGVCRAAERAWPLPARGLHAALRAGRCGAAVHRGQASRECPGIGQRPARGRSGACRRDLVSISRSPVCQGHERKCRRSRSSCLEDGLTTVQDVAATETRIRSTASGKAVLHFATHAIVRDDEPLQSYLALALGSWT